MRIRPGIVYRNIGCMVVICIILYFAYYITVDDNRFHNASRYKQKHLYLTVSKDRIVALLQQTNLWFQLRTRSYFMLEIFLMNLFLTQVVVGIIKDMFLCRWRRRVTAEDMPCRDFVTSVNFFNWTATYLLSSDVVFKYGLFYLSSKEAEEKGFKFVDLYVDGTILKNRSGIFGLVSNCKTASKREIAFKELSRYIDVTIAGKCAFNSSAVNICPLSSDCLSLFSQYPFYFAVENSVCKDYITEKYWDRILVPSIPIVMRRRIYEAGSLPPHSFIAMDDYTSPKEMAEHLINLESDREAYAKYFAWRKGGWTVAPWNAPGYRNGYCRLCERLWEENQEPKVIEDVWAWFDAESKCEDDDFVKSWVKNSSIHRKQS